MRSLLSYHRLYLTNSAKGLVEIQSNGDVKTLTDFDNLKKEIAKVSPTGVEMAKYTPTNTAARSCPTNGADWSASSVLPPTPNKELCGCMVSALSCTAAPKVKDTDAAELFGYICGDSGTNCAGIIANGTTGEYGAYSMCSSLERLAWAMNAVCFYFTRFFINQITYDVF